jgi:hypothetical protein
MAFSFPASPAVNDTYTVGSRTWTWTGTVWEMTSGLITTQQLADLGVTAGKLASNSVTETKILDGSVTQLKFTSGLSGITTCTSSTRPASPTTGQAIFETDTNAFQVWNGSAWLPVGLRPPAAPTSLSATPSATSVSIAFTAGSNGGSAITNYQYAISTNGGSTYGAWTSLSPAATTSPITISGLSMGTAYSVKLRGVNDIGNGIESSAVSFTTLTQVSIEYLVIAGGGGGGENNGGGGGAGGYRSSVAGQSSGGGASAEAALSRGVGTYTVTVGAGGASQVNGSNSVFDTITSVGGGAGAYGGNGSVGGSGGGGGNESGNTYPGAAGTANQGYAGGNTNSMSGASPRTSAGGGGAGAVGGSPTVVGTGGVGGVGVSSSINGSATFRGGGGGGTPSGAGGNGGGGAAGAPATAGTANTGGGGGSNSTLNTGNSRPGGSGVVILRYLTASATSLTITGGTKVVGPAGATAYTVHTFNASGSLVIS